MFLTIKLYLNLDCVLMVNWIISNGTVFDIESQTDLFNIELFWHLTVCKQNLHLY